MRKSILILSWIFICFACNGNKSAGQSITQTNQYRNGEDSLSLYVSQLASEHGEDRFEAMNWLSRHPDISRNPLRELANGTEGWRASGAIQTLGMIGDPEDLPLLEEILLQTPKRSFEAAMALAHHRNPGAIEILTRLSSHEGEEIAGNAIVGLGVKQNEASRPVLESLLASPSAYIRWKSLHALGLLGIEASEELVNQLKLSDPDEEVREKATSILNNADSQ